MQRPIPHLRVTFLTLLAICAFQLLCAAAVPLKTPENRYNDRFAAIRAEFDQAEPPRKAVLLAEAHRLREYVDRAAEIRDWLASVAVNASENPLVRDEAAIRVASIHASEGDFSAADQGLVALGFVRQWSVLGPFSREQNVDVAPRGYRSTDSYPHSRGNIRLWRQVQSLGPSAELKLSDYFPAAPQTIAYAGTSVFSDGERDVALRFSSEAPFSMFVGGARVAVNEQESRFAFDQQAVAVRLNAGWNPLVVRFVLTERPARFALRITELNGSGLALLSSATHESGPLISVTTAPSITPNDLVEMARRRLDSEQGSAAALATVGEIERMHARGADLEHLQTAAQKQPTVERWLDVAESCPDARCRFSAFSSALRAEPKNIDARLGLADYYLSRNQLDRTRDLLREALDISPLDFVVRDRLAELYVSAGLTAVAAKESAGIIRDFPGPLWLARRVGARYADLGLGDDAIPLLQRALSGYLDHANERDLLARIHRRRHDAPALAKLARQALELDPNDLSALAQLAELEFGEGNREAATARLQRAIEIKPDDDSLRETFADMLSRAHHNHASQQQLSAALQINPRLDNVRQRLNLRSKMAEESTENRYLKNAAEVAAAANCTSIQSATNVTGVSDVQIERVYENGLSAIHSQQLFCLTSEQGARDFATRLIQYSPATQELKLLHTRVHKPDGRVIEASEAGETGVADTGVSMYYDVRSRAVHYPALQKGDVVELEYSIAPTAPSNPYGEYFATLVPFRSRMPELLQRYVLITPANRHFNVVEHGMTHAASEEVRGDELIYSWEERDISALPNEPRGPALTESAPYVHVSTFGSWDEIGRWYAQLIRPQFELDSTLRDVASRLTSGKQTEVEKINAIHQFVLRNTHYVALEFGIYSYKPYPVTEVFARRFGDCKDKASLMIALLREAGIDADVALVRTRRLGDVDNRAVSIALFNHAIVYVPKWDLWLDGTAEYAGSRELPLDDQGATALVVGLDGKAFLRRIPLTRPEDNYTHRVVRARIQPDGTIEFTGTAYTRGEDAPGLRRNFEVTERQRDLFRNSLAEVFPTVRLDDVQVDGATDLERDINVQFRGALDTFSGRRVISLNTSWMPRSYVQTLAQLESRTQDLVLSAPWTTEEQLRFQLPAGAFVASVPQDRSFDTPFGSARIHYQRRAREVVISTSVQVRKLRITPAEYDAFREFCRDIESAFRAEVRVILPAS